MKVREARIEDVDAICRLLALLFEQEAEFTPDYARQAAGITAILRDPQVGRFVVLEDDEGDILGAVSLLFVPSTALGGRAALLEDLVILPSRRGAGAGSLLMAETVALARALDCLRVTVLTDSDNLRAQGLYHKFGFRRSGMLPMRLVF
ncbi:GNAT family N-acetyltransferase [Azoarcus sp. KH32C]|uniref:GNAT family N-acetyltransferase n=1 Tax=Azoarcus sp. KH32C TaxID=748247 RepID=UPI0002386742|nr:GNAT family N-acetyltransferase [Azoarcus sp. KH32C]BAL24755.1 hypothetical protein AZKH_2449 [Azoarcus sp. KH32C]